MSIEVILLGIGILLGLVYFVYWAWWAKRDKVVVANSEVYPEFLPKGSWLHRPGGESIYLNYAELSIEASCDLVLTSGGEKLEVKEVEVILDKKACGHLRKYFKFPLRNRLYLDRIDAYTRKTLPKDSKLRLKEAARFHGELSLNCTEEFEKAYEKMEGGFCPEFIQPLLEELETKYQICWTRYDGKKLCWRFPQKWWRNLGKRLWG